MPEWKLNAIDKRLLTAEQKAARELRRLERARRRMERYAEDMKAHLYEHTPLGEPGHPGDAQPGMPPRGART